LSIHSILFGRSLSDRDRLYLHLLTHRTSTINDKYPRAGRSTCTVQLERHKVLGIFSEWFSLCRARLDERAQSEEGEHVKNYFDHRWCRFHRIARGSSARSKVSDIQGIKLFSLLVLTSSTREL
jgi:hypothetical protein